ncbi:hypothetical protein EC991_003779 [Linnemannia zychae]|nr:hypothetical protein EC991_003779 [Linnemannia zychae]
MHQQIDLPPEILDLIFSYLSQEDYYLCLFVSRSWSRIAEAHLYSDITLDARKGTRRIALALETRKHLLRRVELHTGQNGLVVKSLLDMLLDAGNSKSLPTPCSNDRRFATVAGIDMDNTQTRPMFPESTTRRSRLSLTHFSIVGHPDSEWMLEPILYTLTTLTSLKIHFYFSGAFQFYAVDMNTILEKLPHLKHLSIDGHKHYYRVTTEAKGDNTSSNSSSGTTTTSAMDVLDGSCRQHGLESFTFEPTRLMELKEPSALAFFRRLGNLKKIQVNAVIPYLSYRQDGRPWILGQALRQYCPKLETIETNGPVPLWLFDLAIVPHNRIQQIAAMVKDVILPPHVQDQFSESAQRLIRALQSVRLLTQETEELLASKFAEPYFPQLKTLILKGDHCLSAQDLLSLAAQARFLTRFEIQRWPVMDLFISDMYDRDAAAVTTASSNIHSIAERTDTLLESRRLRKRRIFVESDLEDFLHHCANLRQFSVVGHNVQLAMQSIGEERCVRSWACEECLETLRFGFEISPDNPKDHGVVWKHLGRFKRLRYMHLDMSTLLPLPEYGVKNLLEGEISETLEEIRSMPGWWKAKDRRELEGMHKPPRPLPAEVLALIFQYLVPNALCQCLRVSKLWHAEVEARLYHKVVFNSSTGHLGALIDSVRTRKHLVRRVRWNCLRHQVPTVDFLDIVFDYGAYDDDNYEKLFDSALSLVGRDNSGIEEQSTLPPVYPPGPNRLALTHFDFLGTVQPWLLLDSIMCKFTALTSLTLRFNYEPPPVENYNVDIEKILTRFPHLKYLCAIGWAYSHEDAGVQAGGGHTFPLMSDNDDRTAGSRAIQQHPLETLMTSLYLIWYNAPESYSFIRRLGNLRQFAISEQRFHAATVRKSKPWALGRVMKQCCPELESINIEGPGVLRLFDLPILPSNRVDHLAALIPEPLPENARRMSETELDLNLYRRLQDHEINELVSGKCGDAFYPQLKTLVLGEYQKLSAQELILLGVQAPFLTHLDISYSCYYHQYHWEMYESDHPAATPAFTSANLHQKTRISTVSDGLVESQRLRKRREMHIPDLVLFLQLCSSLRYLAVRGRGIPFEDLVNRSNHLDPNGNNSKNKEAASTAEQEEEDTRVIPRWPCEETLESLTIGFDVLADQRKDYKLIWRHLGRFKKLRSLTFTHYDLASIRKHIIPSLSCGVRGLLDGESARTLQEIGGLPSWWEVDDQREMVLLFARSCPKLRVLGLVNGRKYIKKEEVAKYTAFLEDGDVRQCSIPRVFVEQYYHY